MGSLDRRKSLTRTTPHTHLLTDKAFNATIAAPTWEQRPRLILLFTAYPGMGDKK
jgi:hypothetical protein